MKWNAHKLEKLHDTIHCIEGGSQWLYCRRCAHDWIVHWGDACSLREVVVDNKHCPCCGSYLILNGEG